MKASVPSPRARFQGETILVTGASRGLGRAMAQAFAAEGAYVYIGHLARTRDAEETLRLVHEAGGGGATLAFDVTHRPEADGAIERILSERGRLDALVNNAGIARDEFFPLMEQQDWEDVIAVNLGGISHCARAAVRSMMARKRGSIINIGAVSALRASPGQASYAASKAGVLAFTRSLAAELAPHGVRVNAVVPGAIAAGLAARLDKRHAERIRAAIPMGRFGSADEVARAVLFLASDDAAYITGHALVVDGGLSL